MEDEEISGQQQFSGDKRWGGGAERWGVTTGHFTGLMRWESLAAGAGRKGFTVGSAENLRAKKSKEENSINLRPSFSAADNNRVLHGSGFSSRSPVIYYFISIQER